MKAASVRIGEKTYLLSPLTVAELDDLAQIQESFEDMLRARKVNWFKISERMNALAQIVLVSVRKATSEIKLDDVRTLEINEIQDAIVKIIGISGPPTQARTSGRPN